jgi:hypothetical protein
MANFLKKMLRAYGPDRVQASCQFTTAGTGQPSTFNLNGVVSVVRSGVGLYTLTLLDSAKEYHVSVSRQCTAAQADNQAVIGTINLQAKTIIITVASAGAAADTTGITLYVAIGVRVGN